MAKYRVPVFTSASGTVIVETDETDPELIAELTMNEGDFPTICARCSGWGREYSLALGDEWETVDNLKTGIPEVYRLEE